MILVDTEKYWQMVRDQRLLQALEANGVDNWIGYEDCLKEVEEEEDAKRSEYAT